MVDYDISLLKPDKSGHVFQRAVAGGACQHEHYKLDIISDRGILDARPKSITAECRDCGDRVEYRCYG